MIPTKIGSQTQNDSNSPSHTKAKGLCPPSNNSRKIFVGGLPQDIKIEEFRGYFEKFGTLADCMVMCDKYT